MKFSEEDLRELLEYQAKIDSGIRRALRIIDSLSKEKDYDYFHDFYVAVSKEIEKMLVDLKKAGVDISKLDLYSFRHMVFSMLDAQMEGKKDFLHVVYGETMGFMKKGSEWEVVEGSDDPEELDMYLYSKLISGGKKLKLFGMHSRANALKWQKEGIPAGVYFSDKKWIATHYWHTDRDDVIIEVELPASAVVATAENEYKTTRKVSIDEIERFRIV
jgi:hypothetical protein